MTESVLTAFDGRILPFGRDPALRCAVLHVANPRANREWIIAATALVEKMIVATRNVADFAGTGVRLLDPCGPS